jgi:hypothetical protein
MLQKKIKNILPELAQSMHFIGWPASALLTWYVLWQASFWVWRTSQSLLMTLLAMSVLSLMLVRLNPWAKTGWRAVFLVMGVPIATLVTYQFTLSVWVWLVACGVLLAMYPLRYWHDAPWFPTPSNALDGLANQLSLAHNSRILEAGCGTGDGMLALRMQYPHAHIVGVEVSRLLAFIARLRCRWLWRKTLGGEQSAPWQIIVTDLWRHDWRDYELVYVFQRPETMIKVQHKAQQELRSGAWLVSLSFPLPNRQPQHTFQSGRYTIWCYQY